MEPGKNTNKNDGHCNITRCLQCDLCNAINYEEDRTVMPEGKGGIKALYGAEVLFYSFYFPQYKNFARQAVNDSAEATEPQRA